MSNALLSATFITTQLVLSSLYTSKKGTVSSFTLIPLKYCLFIGSEKSTIISPFGCCFTSYFVSGFISKTTLTLSDALLKRIEFIIDFSIFSVVILVCIFLAELFFAFATGNWNKHIPTIININIFFKFIFLFLLYLIYFIN